MHERTPLPRKNEPLQATRITVLPDQRQVIWHLRTEPPLGVYELSLGNGRVSLITEADTDGGLLVTIEADEPFHLEIETEFATFDEQVPAGRSRYLLTYLDRTEIVQQ